MKGYTSQYTDASTDLTHDTTKESLLKTTKLPTPELHEYGFVMPIQTIYDLNKKPHVVKFYPDWVYQGDEVIHLPPEFELTTPDSLDDPTLRRGKFIGVFNNVAYVAIHQTDSYDDMLDEFNQLPDQSH